VADDLQSRYALGSRTTLYLSDLDNPQVMSSNPEIVAVGVIELDETDEYGDTRSIANSKALSTHRATRHNI
jgi:hypothetical protein